MVAVAFRSIEINPVWFDVVGILAFGFFVFMFLRLIWRNLFGGIGYNKKNEDEQFFKLIREWCENGIAITNWLKANYQELVEDLRGTTSRPYFQELLKKYFELWDKLVILDPKLKEDPLLQGSRVFYRSLIVIENQKQD